MKPEPLAEKSTWTSSSQPHPVTFLSWYGSPAGVTSYSGRTLRYCQDGASARDSPLVSPYCPKAQTALLDGDQIAADGCVSPRELSLRSRGGSENGSTTTAVLPS